MKQLYTEIHQGKEIIVINYSALTSGDEFSLLKYSQEYLISLEKSSAIVLEIVSGVKLSPDILEFLPVYIETVRPYVHKWASIGLSPVIAEQLHLDLKIIKFFDTQDEAIRYLVD